MVVRTTALITIYSHWLISLTIRYSGSVWTVDRDLSVVSTQSMSMSIRIREQSTLEHPIITRFNTWHQMSRREGCLFNILVIVLRVSIQDQSAYRQQRVVFMRPYFSHIQDIPLVLSSICFRHNLNHIIPDSLLATLNRVKEISL